MGTHPIFESDFDCLTVRRIGRNGKIQESHQSQPKPKGSPKWYSKTKEVCLQGHLLVDRLLWSWNTISVSLSVLVVIGVILGFCHCDRFNELLDNRNRTHPIFESDFDCLTVR